MQPTLYCSVALSVGMILTGKITKCVSFLCSVLVVAVSTSVLKIRAHEKQTSSLVSCLLGLISLMLCTAVMTEGHDCSDKNKPSSFSFGCFFTLCGTTDFTPNNTNKSVNEMCPDVCQLQGVNKIIYLMDFMNHKGNYNVLLPSSGIFMCKQFSGF